MKTYIPYIALIISVFLLHSCANVQTLGGGPAEKDPPVVQYSIPKQNETDVSQKKFIISFDENIQISNLSQEVIINPYYDLNNLKATPKGKKLELIFKEELKAQTTYTINFGSAIKDLNEKTPIKNFIYSFSTGPYIDTLTYTGIVINNKTHEPVLNTTVGLYDPNTIRPDTIKPLYLANTSDDGSFHFTNLPNTNFRIYAFTDINKNKLIDEKNETYGLLSININPTNNQNDSIYLFKSRTQKNKAKAPQSKENYLDLDFLYGIKTINNSSIKPYQLINNNTTLRLFPDKEKTVELSIVDSTGTNIDTTINLNYRPKPFRDTLIHLKPYESLNPLTLQKELLIELPFLVKQLDTALIYTIEQGDTLPINNTNKTLFYSNNSSIMTFSSDNETDTLNIYIKENAITFKTEQQNKTYNQIKLPTEQSNYGSLNGVISTTEKNYVLYLINSKGKTIHKETNPTVIDYKYMKPGSYKIAILIDENGNQSFDTGSLNALPESYYLYDKPLEVKKGWDVGNIHISF